MKSLAVLFFGMLLWAQTSLAGHADVAFFTKRGEPFQVVLNGRLINRYATDQIRILAIPGGFHVAEIRLPGRFGALVHRTRIFVEPGFRTEYLIHLAGHRPKVIVSKVRQYPLAAVRPLPRPYRPRHEGHHRHDGRHNNDHYEDRHHDRYENDRYENRNQDRYENDRYEDRSQNRYENERHEERRGDGRYDQSLNVLIADKRQEVYVNEIFK